MVHLVGCLNLETIAIAKDGTGRELNWIIPKPPEYRDAAVLSHSCEIAPENGIKLTSVILAPVRDIDGATEREKIAELIASNAIAPGAAWTFLKYYYLNPNERLQYAHGAVVDFSKCFSVRKNSYGYLVNKKVLQMTPESRSSFALKLALYFHRAQEPTVPEAGVAAAV